MILRLIYSLLYSIALIFVLPFQFRKRQGEIRRRWLREKFGFILSKHQVPKSPLPPFTKGGRGGIIWIHAVSVGEVIAAIPLLHNLKKKFPSINFLVSTITDTGQKIAFEKVPENTQVIYLPFDLMFVIKKTLKKIRPALFIAMETELWPNLFVALKKHGIPALIMNGRISDDSFKGYKKIRFFMRNIIKCIDLFGMQDAVYAKRIKELGAPENKIKVLGNFKFDTKPSENIPEWTKLLSRPVIIAGSTHRGEEAMILSAFEKLKDDFPEVNLIIAPRHPERFGEVEELVRVKGFSYIKRSELKTLPPLNSPFSKGGHEGGEFRTVSGQIVILDVIGELSSVYGISDIAIIGGSFIEHGGQNLLEPAYWSKPIICGRHMENFPFAKEFYEKRAAIETDESNIFDRLRELLKSPEKRKTFGGRARELYDEKAGAVEKAVLEIEKYLNVAPLIK